MFCTIKLLGVSVRAGFALLLLVGLLGCRDEDPVGKEPAENRADADADTDADADGSGAEMRNQLLPLSVIPDLPAEAMYLIFDDKVAYQIATWLDQNSDMARTWLGGNFHFVKRTHVTSVKHYGWNPTPGQDLTMERSEKDFWKSRDEEVELELVQIDSGFSRDGAAMNDTTQLLKKVYMYEGQKYAYGTMVDFAKKRNAVFACTRQESTNRCFVCATCRGVYPLVQIGAAGIDSRAFLDSGMIDEDFLDNNEGSREAVCLGCMVMAITTSNLVWTPHHAEDMSPEMVPRIRPIPIDEGLPPVEPTTAFDDNGARKTDFVFGERPDSTNVEAGFKRYKVLVPYVKKMFVVYSGAIGLKQYQHNLKTLVGAQETREGARMRIQEMGPTASTSAIDQASIVLYHAGEDEAGTGSNVVRGPDALRMAARKACGARDDIERKEMNLVRSHEQVRGSGRVPRGFRFSWPLEDRVELPTPANVLMGSAAWKMARERHQAAGIVRDEEGNQVGYNPGISRFDVYPNGVFPEAFRGPMPFLGKRQVVILMSNRRDSNALAMRRDNPNTPKNMYFMTTLN